MDQTVALVIGPLGSAWRMPPVLMMATSVLSSLRHVSVIQRAISGDSLSKPAPA